MERENPAFKEFVKIAITPMLLSLSIMTVAESENEILGFGVGVILMNVGMYFVLPFVICYYVKKIVRTRGVKQSNLRVISNCNVLSVVKTSLFGLMALLVLTVSVSSAFETAYADEDDPIRVILDITHQNILDSIEIATENGDLTADEAAELITSVEIEYRAALDLTNGEDVVAAKESVIQTMSSFEVVAAGIEALDNQASTQLPPGFGAGFDSASDTGITQGQGLGVGGVPPGILKQITAANIFEIQEGITGIDEEVDELRGLIESNGLDVNLEEFDKSINLAKEVLANGEIPNAQAKLALANEIKNDLYDQIDAAVEESQDERVEQFVENSINDIESILEKGENLGLTKKVIDELQDTLDVLKSGDIDDILEKTSDDSEFAKEVEGNDNVSKEFDDGGSGNSENAPGQNDEGGPGNSGDATGQNKEDAPGNSGDATGQNKEDAPGNSGDAPGQNRGNEDAELPPGFGAAGENPSKNANENAVGLGLGKEAIPPGLAKLFGYDDGTGNNKDFEAPEGLPPGFGAAIDSASDTGKANGIGLGLGGENIPPGQFKKLDYAEFGTYSPDDYFEDATEDLREDSFEDNYDKMYKNSKAKEKKEKQNADRLLKEKGNTGGGNPNCNDEGITDGDSENLTGEVGVGYTVQGFTAVGSNCKDSTDKIKIKVDGPSGQLEPSADQPYTFQPDEAGTWIIQASAVGQFGTRTIEVTGGLDADAGPDQTVDDCSDITLDGSGSTDSNGTIVSYSWVKETPQPNLFSPQIPSSATSPTFTPVDVSSDTTYTFTLTVTDNDTNQNSESVDITVTDGGSCAGGDVADAGTDFSVVQNTPFVQLDGSGSTTPNTGYTWTNSHGIILSESSIVNPTFTAPAHISGPPSGNQYTFTLTVTFSGSPDSVDTVTVTIDKN
jgi:hypothetical protein